jgi:RimJ/RimL family protein N-acetyltransferase
MNGGIFGAGEVVLQDERVLLRPMSHSDLKGFEPIAFTPNIWRYFAGAIENAQDLRDFVEEAVAGNREGRYLAFTIMDKAGAAVAGTMRFGNLSPRDERVEIGWSWLGEAFQGKGINARCKYLMMKHAFDAGMKRVEYKTDVLNQVARRALVRIGATEEGVLRSHTLMPRGRRRDTIYYSVLAAEWPSVEERLRDLIARSP